MPFGKFLVSIFNNWFPFSKWDWKSILQRIVDLFSCLHFQTPQYLPSANKVSYELYRKINVEIIELLYLDETKTKVVLLQYASQFCAICFESRFSNLRRPLLLLKVSTGYGIRTGKWSCAFGNCLKLLTNCYIVISTTR